MYQKTTTVVNQTGLHARPASCFVRQASKYKSDIKIGKAGGENSVNAKSIVRLLTLGLTKGTNIIISANGEDEQEAVDALTDLVNSGCGE